MNTTEMHIPSNRVRDIERYCHDELDTLYGDNEVAAFVRILFEGFLGWDTAALLLHRNDSVNQSDLLRFHWAVEDLKRFRPIQHIVGYTSFCGCRIDVDGSTLIPRPETEEMVLHTVALLADRPPQRILEVCSGSGCIAIALKKSFPDAEVTGVELSPTAHTMARHNANANSADVLFMQADVLSGSTYAQGSYSLIISNPPYVRQCERTDMSRNVVDWEPAGALFVPDDDPLIFYRVIAVMAARHLTPDGMLMFEINEQLGAETLKLVEGYGFSATLHNDFRGKARFLVCQPLI